MEGGVLKQLEACLGSEWNCICGSSLESSRIELVSKTKNSLLVRYSCQICSREQVFTVPVGLNKEVDRAPLVEVPNGTITSDDVLDIKTEVAETSTLQIKALARRQTLVRATASKITRR
jgi:hypothetical protein